MVPRTIKISHFPPNGRSGIVLLGVSGRIPSHLLLMAYPHRACWHTSACRVLCRDFRSLHFTYLPDGCLFDDVCRKRTLSLESPGGTPYLFPALRAHASSWAHSFLEPLIFSIASCIDFRVALGMFFEENRIFFNDLLH